MNGKILEGYIVDLSGVWLVDVLVEKFVIIRDISNLEIKEFNEVVKKDFENKEMS